MKKTTLTAMALVFAALLAIPATSLTAAPSDKNSGETPRNYDVALEFDNGTDRLIYQFTVHQLEFIDHGAKNNVAHISGSLVINGRAETGVNFDMLRRSGSGAGVLLPSGEPGEVKNFEPWGEFVNFAEAFQATELRGTSATFQFVREGVTTFEWIAGYQVLRLLRIPVDVLIATDPFTVIEFDLAHILAASLSPLAPDCGGDYSCSCKSTACTCSNKAGDGGVYEQNESGGSTYTLIDGTGTGNPAQSLTIKREGPGGVGGCGKPTV